MTYFDLYVPPIILNFKTEELNVIGNLKNFTIKRQLWELDGILQNINMHDMAFEWLYLAAYLHQSAKASINILLLPGSTNFQPSGVGNLRVSW